MRTEQLTKCSEPLQKLGPLNRLKPHDDFKLLTVQCGTSGVFSVFLFLVLVSVLFHLLCVKLKFIQVEVAEWPPFGKELLVQLTVCFLFYVYL